MSLGRSHLCLCIHTHELIGQGEVPACGSGVRGREGMERAAWGLVHGAQGAGIRAFGLSCSQPGAEGTDGTGDKSIPVFTGNATWPHLRRDGR